MNNLTIYGRKGLKIVFDHRNPDNFLGKKSLLGLNNEEKKKALKKPFIVTDNINISIYYMSQNYKFMIFAGYDWNGANVPAFAQFIIGQRTEPRFMLSSCVHDYLCEHHTVINDDRYLSTLIFETLCLHFGKFNAVKRWAMFHGVDNWQKLFGKDLNGKRWGK